MDRKVVITGIGVIAPCGIGKENFWVGLESGRSFIEEDQEMIISKTNSKVCSRVKDFYLEKFFLTDNKYFSLNKTQKKIKEELEKLDRFVQFGFCSGKMAFEDAFASIQEKQEYNPDRFGAVFSSAIGGTPLIEKIFQNLSNFGETDISYKPVGSFFYDSGMFNYPNILLSKYFGLNGIVTSISTGCTAGIDSFGLGFQLIKSGEADIMLVGASEAPLCPLTYATLDVIGCLSKLDGDPSKSSRPFDNTRAGFVISEGAACLVLENFEHALHRGAKVYSEVKGFASTNNAFHMNDLPSDGEPMRRVIEKLLDDSSVERNTIDYINAHGSSTKQNDIFETNAYKKIFGKRAYSIPISSTKSMIGHSLSSASLIGVIAAIGSINRGVVHPTINYEYLDPECDLNYTPNKAIEHNVNRALITASGFGGIHSAAIIQKT